MTTKNVRWYPGMLPSTGAEIFNYENEDFVIENGQIKPFDQLSSYYLRILINAINSDPKVDQELQIMHPDCEMKRVRKFSRCRFGGLDYTADIIDGKLQPGEFWPCPLRGSCRSEGILCKLPEYQGQVLSNKEIKLIQLLSSNATNEVIAYEMEMPAGTLHRDKAALYRKLGNIQTKQEVAQIAFFLNLI